MGAWSERAALVEIDPLCEAFEAALRAQDTPSIEEFVHRVGDDARGYLLRELVALELHYRGLEPTPDVLRPYRTRFPEFSAEVEELERGSGHASGLPAAALTPGQTFGAYTILGEIGRGGMGVVYEATHGGLQRRVALKVIAGAPGGQGRLDRRFEREARAIARLHHPNIVPVFEFGVVDGSHYFAMPAIGGCSMAEGIARARQAAPAGAGVLPPERRDLVLGQIEAIARALHHVHLQGIVHRDVKPSNILLDEDGAAWLVDFGLARFEDSDLTRSHELLGTIRYLPPERLSGHAGGDARGDVYALGMSLYEALALGPAFQETEPRTLVRAILDEDVPLLGSRVGGVSRELETLVATAVARDPARRYPTALALADDIARLRAGVPIEARRASAFVRTGLWVRRNRAVTAALVLAVAVAGVATLAAALYRSQRTRIQGLSSDLGELLVESEASRDSLRRALYRADMQRSAQQASRSTRAAAVERTLADWAPGEGVEDLRGWEWYLLRALVATASTNVWYDSHGGMTVDWSPDGSLVAMAGRGGVSLWDAATGVLVRTIDTEGHPSCVRFSPDGDRLAVCDMATTRVVDVRTREVLALLPERSSHSLTWHPDGRHLVIAGGGIWIWDPSTDAPPASLDGVALQEALDIDDDGRRIAYSRHDEVVVRDWETRQVLARYPGNDFVGDVEFSRDGQKIVVANRADEIHVFEAATGRALTVIPAAHDATIHSVRWSPDGSMVVTASADFTVRVHDAADGTLLRNFLGQEGHVLDACFAPDGRTVAAVSQGGNLRLWSLERPGGFVRDRATTGRRAGREGMAWSPMDGAFVRRCALGEEIWHQDGLRPRRAWRPGPWVVERSRDGALVVSAGPDGAAIRRGTTGELVLDLAPLEARVGPRDHEPPISARFAADGRRCVLSRGGRLWVAEDLAGEPRLRPVPAAPEVREFSLAPDGRHILSSSWHSIVEVDTETGEVTRTVPEAVFDVPGHDYRVPFHGPRPGQVAVIHGARLIVLDGETLEAVHEFVEHGAPIRDAAWSPDGERIATCSQDRTVGIFDPERGLTASLPGDGLLISLAWSADGTQLGVVDLAGDLALWNASDAPRVDPEGASEAAGSRP